MRASFKKLMKLSIAAMSRHDPVRTEQEMGDLLFALVNYCRFIGVDAEEALRGTVERFSTRFSHIEESLKSHGKELKDTPLEELDRLWEEAKRR